MAPMTPNKRKAESSQDSDDFASSPMKKIHISQPKKENSDQKIDIFIFRRDLRIQDNLGLLKLFTKNIKNQTYPILPIFIFNPHQIERDQNPYFSDACVQFMCESLLDLQGEFAKKTAKCVNKCAKITFFKGEDLKILEHIHTNIVKINSVNFNSDVTPYATKRDLSISNFCQKHDIEVITSGDYMLHNPYKIKTKSTDSYFKVYGMFKKHCYANFKPDKPTLLADDQFEKLIFYKMEEESRKSFKNIGMIEDGDLKDFYVENPKISVHGFKEDLDKKLEKLRTGHWDKYHDQRVVPSEDTSTKLSAYMKFGRVSCRQIYEIASKRRIQALVDQCYWREFYFYLTVHYPDVLEGMKSKFSDVKTENQVFNKKYETLEWNKDEKLLNAWKNGKTGYPIVDAGMRQLNKINFMHNRLRMVTAMFFTKDLYLDWKEGERYFASKLVDYDPCLNNGGWQWSASTGADAAPYFRIFNPWLQMQRFDKNAVYIKKWVKEFKHVPVKDIMKWQDKKVRDRVRKSFVELKDYPEPVVDHDKAKNECIAAFKELP